jgi:hypothetical protein
MKQTIGRDILKKFVLALILGCCGITAAYAGGISSPNGSMYLGNLKIGQTYSLKNLLGYPFQITYKGRSMVDVAIQVLPASSPTSDGFENLQDMSWFKIEKERLALEPGQTGATDILITIPDDERYLGKKLYVKINPQTSAPAESSMPGLAVSIGLVCGLRLEIAGRPPTSEEIRLIKRQFSQNTLQVNVTPERIFLPEVPCGTSVDVFKMYGNSIKISNSSDFTVKAVLSIVSPGAAGIQAPDGYEVPADNSWFSLARKKISIKKNAVGDIHFSLDLPADTALRGKKLFFIAAVDVTSRIHNVRYLTKVYVDTAK